MNNSYGLSRDIPEAIKRKIRQDCGFGCVVCGSAIIEYEHIEPTFADAKEHDPSCMTLLCPTCHGNVTRGFWSKEKIKKAQANPFCKTKGFSNAFFDLGSEKPILQFASFKLENCQISIMV